MEKQTSNNVKLGIFVTVGVLLFIVGIYVLGRTQHLFGKNIHISCVFNNVNGLKPGSNVRFSGIDVGTVEDIAIITDTSARVDLRLDADVQKHIKKDSRAVIGSEGLMGNKTVNISPGTPESAPVTDNMQIAADNGSDIDVIMGQLKKTSQNASAITADLTDIFHSVKNGKGTIGKLIMDSSLAEDFVISMRNLRNATGGFKQTVSNLNEGTSGIKKTLGAIQEGAEGFKDNMDAAKHNFLLKGYFKKKEKEKEKAIKDAGKDKEKTDKEKAKIDSSIPK